MKTYTITLSDVEDKALACVAISQQEWIENVVKDRCRIAIDDVFNQIANSGVPLSGTKEDMILSDSVKTLAQREAETPPTPSL